MTNRIVRDAASTRREIDVAVGILIGVHGCSSDDAFDIVASHALVSSEGLLPTARAIIEVAQGGSAGSSVASLFDRSVAAA